MIQTITTDVQFTAHFRGADERGDVVASSQQQGTMSALTPLAAMELYEQLHAKRNEVRRQAGLAEIATSDEGVLVLAFLRLMREEPAMDLGAILRRWEGAASLVQMNRLEEEFTLTAEQLEVWTQPDAANGQAAAEVTGYVPQLGRPQES